MFSTICREERKEAEKRGRAKGRRKETKKEELEFTHTDTSAADKKVLGVR